MLGFQPLSTTPLGALFGVLGSVVLPATALISLSAEDNTISLSVRDNTISLSAEDNTIAMGGI